MQIPVLVEPVAGNGFRARGIEPFALCADAPTREEALAMFKQQLQDRLRGGAAIVPLEVAIEPHPLAEFAGMFKDDPMLAEWKQSMAEYRRQIDEGPDIP